MTIHQIINHREAVTAAAAVSIDSLIDAAAEAIRPLFKPDRELSAKEQHFASEYRKGLDLAVREALALDDLPFATALGLCRTLYVIEPPDEDLRDEAAHVLRSALEMRVFRLLNCRPTPALLADVLDLYVMYEEDSAFPDQAVPMREFIGQVRAHLCALEFLGAAPAPQPEQGGAA